MVVKNKSIKNYVDLIWLKAGKMLENEHLSIILDDDIWENDMLIVKSGRYLTEKLINKLLNFGIKKVNVNFEDTESNENYKKNENILINKFIKTQNVLVIENNFLNTGWLVKNLLTSNFNKNNIFVTSAYNSINKYFRSKKINFIFISCALYEKCQKCVDKYSLLKDTHVFVIMEKDDSARKIKNNYNSDIRFLIKPLSIKRFNFFIKQVLNLNLLNFYMDDAKIS